jgi:integrase
MASRSEPAPRDALGVTVAAPANDNRDGGRIAAALIEAAPNLPRETADLLAQLASSLEARRQLRHTSGQLTDNGIVEAGSGSSPTEEPMYVWVATTPEPHRKKFRVAVKTLDGKQARHSFESEEAAREFIRKASRKKLPGGGTKMEKAIEEYVASRTDLKPSTIETIRFRLAAVTRERTHVPIEVFPWETAWKERVAVQATDSQHGTKSVLAGLFAWAVKQGILRKPPELPEVTGQKRRGKNQLRIDEAKKMVALALGQRDPLALAVVTMLYTGMRPGEAMALRVRDLDDGATVLWVAAEDGKTAAARRMVEVNPPALGTLLAELAEGRPGTEYLFPFESKKKRCKGPIRSRTHALYRRLRRLCTEAGVPVVVPHSMRGLHSTIAVERGATGKLVAAAIGHTSFERITVPHYLAPGTAERAQARRVYKALAPTRNGEVPPKFTSPPPETAPESKNSTKLN